MSTEQPTEQELLQNVLEPLLEDFQYWFDRSISLLKKESVQNSAYRSASHNKPFW